MFKYTRVGYFIKMSLEKIIENNKIASELLHSIKSEASSYCADVTAMTKRELIKENEELRQQIEFVKAQLIQLETRNGLKQVPVPGVTAPTMTYCETTSNYDSTNLAQSSNAEQQQIKKPKEKKPKKGKTGEISNVPATEPPIDVGRLDFRVGKIVEISRHPDADTLYVEKIDCGEEKPRTILSGLVENVPIEEMRDRMVVILCNLKPSKMRGIVSEGMVMCAVTPEKVEPLSPPADAVPGDVVLCEGYEHNPDAQLSSKKKIFETCAIDLLTNSELIACYKGVPLAIPGKGNVTAQTLKNVNVK